jgi:hypothetical protein
VPATSRTSVGSRRGPTKGDQREQALLDVPPT